MYAESDELWVVPVGMELVASGLYDVRSGTWFDVLAAIDIDTRTAEGLERVR